MPKDAYRIRRYKHPRLKYVVRSKLNEKWERRFFATKGEAQTYVQQKTTELLNQGREGAQFPSWLRVMAQHGQELLQPYGKTISDAVNFYIKHLEAAQRSKVLSDAVSELIENRKSSGASRRYCNDLRLRLGRFCKDFEGRIATEITTADVDSWLAGLEVAPVTRNTFRRDLRTLFSFCLSRNYCTSNPVSNVRKAKEIDGEVGILSVSQAARLLEAACDDIVPYLALGAFAGLRPAELQRVSWDEIDFDSKLIEVKAKKSKTARRRFVKIRPNLERWILPHRKVTGQICPQNLRKLELDTRERAGLREWPPNALRHSFASYHLAQFNNAAELALEMGHTNQQMIFDHYRQLVKPNDADRYWSIVPSKASKKVPPTAGA
ncbi:MAG TPA: tyrosine-type recombinase/integrase [Chthoniobacter sp.]